MYVNAHIHGTASEWFSTGITLHELLTGRRPFEAGRLQLFRQCAHFPEHSRQDYHPNYQADPMPGAGHATPPNRSQRACMQMRAAGGNNNKHNGCYLEGEGDSLWPEHLYQCDYLSSACKDFVRALLIPDV